MAHWKLLYPTKYIGACDMDGKDFHMTIKELIEKESLVGEGGETDTKPALTFVGAEKKLILNKTNAKTIARLHGPETDDWKGKRITLYPTTCQAFGGTHECIRVKSTIPKPAQQKPPQADQRPPEDDYDGPPADYVSQSAGGDMDAFNH